MDTDRPRIALTLGDVAGIGPEILARAWSRPELHAQARPCVIGPPTVIKRALEQARSNVEMVLQSIPGTIEPSSTIMPVVDEGDDPDLSRIAPGTIDARSGESAYRSLIRATDAAMQRRVEAICTLPLNKEALHAAGIKEPGHTEILARRCGVERFAMMLYLGPPTGSEVGLGVIHVTLHVPLRRVFELITPEAVAESIALADQGMRPFTGDRAPRIGVAALNPHASEHGLFGDEEARLIAPGVELAYRRGLRASGPIAADTLFRQGVEGRFDAIVAMFHDQGHIALKTLDFDRAVNVTLGLPIVRTSVAHGTAYDIVGTGAARPDSLFEAVRVAALMARYRRLHPHFSGVTAVS